MPYIAREDRERLDCEIDALADRIVEASKAHKEDAAFAGLLNYSCSALALRVVRRRFGAMRYWIIAAVTGALSNAADEFYRRVGAAYEDRQIAKSGDLPEFESFAKDIAAS